MVPGIGFQQQWRLQVPWGTLSLLSHGHPDAYPVLLVHGREDSAAVFKPMLEEMNDNYYFVAFDMPGNGLSDAFPNVSDVQLDPHEPHYAVVFDTPPKPKPPFLAFNKHRQFLGFRQRMVNGGVKLMRFHFLYAMELVVAHLGWDKFIFIGHSMGCEQGLYYNAIYPNRITKMVLCDAGPTIIRMQVDDPEEYQKFYYDDYYDHYHWENYTKKVYTKNTATQAMRRLRNLTEQQCEDLLERNFYEFGDIGNWHPTEAWHLHNTAQRKEALTVKALLVAKKAQNCQTSDVAQNRQTSNVSQNRQTSDVAQALSVAQNADVAQTSDMTQKSDVAQTSDVALKSETGESKKRTVDRDAPGYLSWDNRLKNLAPTNFGNDYYYELFKTVPPTLAIAASDGARNAPRNPKWRQGAKELLDRLAQLENFTIVNVIGGHDVHFTNPELVVPHIIKFLNDNKCFSKL